MSGSAVVGWPLEYRLPKSISLITDLPNNIILLLGKRGEKENAISARQQRPSSTGDATMACHSASATPNHIYDI